MTIPSCAAALAMFISPSGWPNLAKAAGDTKIGREDLCPKILHSVVIADILFRLTNSKTLRILLQSRGKRILHTRPEPELLVGGDVLVESFMERVIQNANRGRKGAKAYFFRHPLPSDNSPTL